MTGHTIQEFVEAAINVLERKQNRAVREHLLGDANALTRIQAIDGQIVALRAQLTQEK